MKILMLAHRIPYPPHTGDKVRAYHVARHFARHHSVTLAFVIDDPRDRQGVDVLRDEIGDLEVATVSRLWGMARGVAGLPRGRAASVTYFGSAALRDRIDARLASDRYDLVYVSSSPMAQYVSGDDLPPIVMDFVDVDSEKWTQYAGRVRAPQAWLYAAEGRCLARFEQQIGRRAAVCLFATPLEEQLFRTSAPWARTAVMANGVDLQQYAALNPAGAPPVAIFTGAMDYLPNIDGVEYFCRDVFPAIRREVPDARFLIVGLNPSPSVRRLASVSGVTVTGSVPDVRPYYAESAVCVAPLRLARGVQNKVLQGMAMGLPVVATRQACQGIDLRPGQDALVEDAPDRFAAHVVALFRDSTARAALGQRGRAFVEAHHSWSASFARLDALVAEAVGGPGAAAGLGRAAAGGAAAS